MMTKRMIHMARPQAERSPKQPLILVFLSLKSMVFPSPSSCHPSFKNDTWLQE